jgi:hypothetical protein
MPGAVTLMLVPLDDPAQPDAPLPRQPFLDAVCRYLDPRRLVTTEVILRGPAYTGIWISVGIKVGAGFVDSAVTEAVKAELLDFLAPSAGIVQSLPDVPLQLFAAGSAPDNGWKLGKSVIALELAAVAARVKGVEFVQENLILADESGTILPRIDMTGLQLPRVLGIRVVNGAPASLDELRGTNTGTTTVTPTFLQIPAIPEECH